MFTVEEEITLMKMYSGFTPNRQIIISKLKSVLPLLEEDADKEMKDLTDGVIRKLTVMNDKAFSEIDFSVALDEETPEV